MAVADKEQEEKDRDEGDSWENYQAPRVSDEDLGHPVPEAFSGGSSVHMNEAPKPGESAEEYRRRRGSEQSAESAAARPAAEAAREARGRAAQLEAISKIPPPPPVRSLVGGADIPRSLNTSPTPTYTPPEPQLSEAVMPALQQNAQALQAPAAAPQAPAQPMPQKAPSAVARATGGVGPSPSPQAAPGGLVGPSPDATLGLSQAPQTAPPEAPKAPSAVERLLASRERDRDELRRAQYDAETRRMSAQGLNAVRAGLAMEAGHSPDAEAERSSMEAADAPVRDVLARQKSDADFQGQLKEAQEYDKRQAADDIGSPESARATLMARAAGYRGGPITLNEWAQTHDVLQLQQLEKQRKTQAAEAATKNTHEVAADAEAIREHNLQHQDRQAAIRAQEEKGAKVTPASPAVLQQMMTKSSALEANEAARKQLLAAGVNPVARSAVLNRYLPQIAAGVAPPNTRENKQWMDAIGAQIPGALRDGDTKSMWHDTHHDDESKQIEDFMDVNAKDPRMALLRKTYANTQQKVYGSRGHSQVEMHFPDGSAQLVPVNQVAKAIMMGGRTQL